VTPGGRVLIADDQPDVLHSLRLLVKRMGLEVEAVTTPEAVLGKVRDGVDLVLMDLNYTRDTTSGQEGLDLLTRIREIDGGLPVVVMTAWSTIDLAVEAVRRGARDFLSKPWENDRVAAIIRTHVELRRALRTVQRQAEAQKAPLGALLGTAPAMRQVLDLIERVGPSDANILITGENGTGKGVVARLLHSASLRADKPLVTVDVGALSDNLIESELFGHVRGAFTDARADREGRFEIADGATLFLDEIGNLPLAQQSKLLRVLETGEFEPVGSSKTRHADVRVLAATNADLEKECAAGRFRQDLRYRLNTIEIRLPPLRERVDDIPLLAEHFLARHARKHRRELAGFTEAAVTALIGYTWAGNVRELSHVVERGVLMARGDSVTADDLGLVRSAPAVPGPRPGDPADSNDDGDLDLERSEKRLIERALARYQGNAVLAAKALGLSRSAFYRRAKTFGL
jgi:DNA-binding NtrC family response regulator